VSRSSLVGLPIVVRMERVMHLGEKGMTPSIDRQFGHLAKQEIQRNAPC
jgi:hypothetical protein